MKYSLMKVLSAGEVDLRDLRMTGMIWYECTRQDSQVIRHVHPPSDPINSYCLSPESVCLSVYTKTTGQISMRLGGRMQERSERANQILVRIHKICFTFSAAFPTELIQSVSVCARARTLLPCPQLYSAATQQNTNFDLCFFHWKLWLEEL